MKIDKVEMFHVDAGWRPWTFIKISIDDGIIGWSECTDSHGSPSGMHGVLTDLEPLMVKKDPREIEKIVLELKARTHQSPGSIIQKTIGGIENALWDIKAKALGVPVYELFGGPIRERVQLYWSHCGTSRVRASDKIKKPPIKNLEDVKNFGQEFNKSGFKSLKTNIAVFDHAPTIYMPGFSKSFGGPELNLDSHLLKSIEAWISHLRAAVDDDVEIALDLNFNFKTAGYKKIGRVLEKYNLSWLEVDSYNPKALKEIKDSINLPIASCENLYGPRQFLPYFENRSMDIVCVDVIWNGLSDSKVIADIANIHEMNICPHNYNGHLSTFISVHLCSIIPNLQLVEIDVDDVPWRDELFTNIPDIQAGYMNIPTTPGWGTDVNETAMQKYRWLK